MFKDQHFAQTTRMQPMRPRLKLPKTQYKNLDGGQQHFYSPASGALSIFLVTSAEPDAKLSDDFSKFCERLAKIIEEKGMQVSVTQKTFANRKLLKSYLNNEVKSALKTNPQENPPTAILLIAEDFQYWENTGAYFELSLAIPVHIEPTSIITAYDDNAFYGLTMKLNLKLRGQNFALMTPDGGALLEETLVIAFNVRRFRLPETFMSAFTTRCSELWIIGYSANYVTDNPQRFASNCTFMPAYSNQLARRLHYEEVLVEILNKVHDAFISPQRIFLLFSYEDCSEPFPLFFLTIQKLKLMLADLQAEVPYAIVSYSKDIKSLPDAQSLKTGTILQADKFFNKDPSLDVRYVDSNPDVSKRHPQISRAITLLSVMDSSCTQLAQFLLDLNFCRQTIDVFDDPMPAPIYYARETAKRAERAFLTKVKQPTTDGHFSAVIDLCNKHFTYAKKKDGRSLEDVSFAF